MLGQYALLCYEEWLRWISKTSDVTIRNVEGFLNIPQMLTNSGIYKKWDQVRDEIGKLQLQTDRPLCLCFGWVKIDGVYKHFPNSVMVRFTMDDDNVVYREFPLVKEEYMVDLNDSTTGKTYPNIFDPQNVIIAEPGGKLMFFFNFICLNSIYKTKTTEIF